jgi:hypothetical protein
VKKERKSTNFLMMHNLDPNIGGGNKSISKKGKKYKEDQDKDEGDI